MNRPTKRKSHTIMQLSKNFSLVELTKSQTAERKGIPNDPSPDHQENLRLLCERVLQPVRDHFNHVVSVSSGYRSPQLVPSHRQQLRFAALQRDGGRLRNLWHAQQRGL